jgi:antitoxin VapB
VAGKLAILETAAYFSERQATVLGLSKTAVVEQAVDLLRMETPSASSLAERMAALLAQLDRIPDRANAFEPLEWDDLGLPK